MSVCSIKKLTLLQTEMQNLINPSSTGAQSNKSTSTNTESTNSLPNSSANKISNLIFNIENAANSDFNINPNLLNSNLQAAIKPISVCSLNGNDKPIITLVSSNSSTPDKSINSKDHNYGTINLKPVLNSSTFNERDHNNNNNNNSNTEIINNKLLLSSPSSNLSVISLKSPQTPTKISLQTNNSPTLTSPSVANNNNNNKQILKQQVMIGGKLVTSINRPVVQDPVQYIVKKSNNNQTIVIVSKPSSVTQSSANNTTTSTSIPLINNSYINNNSNLNGDLITQLKPIQLNESNLSINNLIKNNNSNLITQVSNSKQNNNNSQQILINKNGLFNNNFLMKPITLIPINKVNEFDKQQSCNGLVYKLDDGVIKNAYPNTVEEVVEISTATVEIDSTIEEVNDSNENTNIDDNNEDDDDDNEAKASKKAKKKQTNSDEPNKASLKKKNPHKDITRCICGMDHDDGFMICCDKCLVWQHIVCMDINKKKIPDKFFCERCQPRVVNEEKAKEAQKKYFNNLKKSNKANNAENAKNSNVLKLNSNSNNIDYSSQESNDNSCSNDDVGKLEHIELDGQNDLLTADEENKKAIKSQAEISSTLSAENEKNSKSSKKTIDIIDDKENGVGSNEMVSFDSAENSSCVKKRKNKVKTIREELENSSLEANSVREDANSKREKQNEYSSEFLKLQTELNEPDTSFIASSSSTATASNRKSDNIKHLIQADCLKLVKLVSSAESGKKLFRVKSSQNIKKNAIVGEYIGRVMLEDEYSQESNNPFIMFYELEANDSGLPSSTSYATSSSSLSSNTLDSRICIDSSSIGNMTRYIRKSCSPNCKLKHVADNEGNIHFLILSLANIVKGAEISLPLEMDKTVLNNNNYFFCNCDSKSCSLKAKLNEETEIKAKKESAAAKRKRENSSSDSIDEPKKQAEEKSKTKEKNAKPSETKSENENHSPQPNSKKKPASANNTSSLAQSKPIEKVNSDSKVLSREDRKLMSYMRVIEKLEMQGKRKKMLKEQKETSAASSTEPKAEPNSASTQSPAETETKNHTKNGLDKTKEKNKNLGLIHSRHNDPERNHLDNEIANIIENAIEKQDPNIANPSLVQNNTCQSAEKLTVKSPDFSFVNLTIQPRKTLNLLQRNLSSPSLSCEPRVFLESSKSLTDNYIAEPDTSSQTGSTFDEQFNEQSNQHIFNPKKYWLKCSSVCEPNEQAPSKTQPLKKRRHMFEENSTASTDVSLNPINELEISNNNKDASDSFEQQEKPNENPTQANFENNQIFIPSLISNAFESYYNMNHCSPYHLTPNYPASSEMNPFFQYEFNCQLKSQLSGNELNDSSCSLVSVSKEEVEHLNREPLELSQSELDAANAEAQKRKKVSLAEYRQRKETKPNGLDEPSNLNKQESIKNEAETNNHEEKLSNQVETNRENDMKIETENESKQDCKSKLSKFLCEMMVSKRQAKPEPLETRSHQHFDKFFQKNFFEERENNLKNNLNISIKQSLPYPSETKNENTSLSSSRLESCSEQENSFTKSETKSEAYAQNLSLVIPISGEFPNKQSTPVSESTSRTESKFDDFEEKKNTKARSEEKLDASLIKIVDSSKNKNKMLDGNDYVSRDTDYETSKNNKNEENSTRNLSKSSERSNSKSSTRSSGGYSNLSSVSSDSNSNFDKSSQKSITKTHSHRSRLIDSNNNNKNNSSKNRNLSEESNSSVSSSQSLRSNEFKSSIPSGYKNEASFRNESKASRSTISSKTSKNNSSDEDSYNGKKIRKRYVHVDEKNDIKFGLVKSSENFNSPFESYTRRKSYYNEDEQLDRSSNLHRRLGKEYDSNKYDFKYKFSDYHHRSHDRYQTYKHESTTDSYYKNRSNESEFNSNSLKTYNLGESSKNRLRTRSSSRESGIVVAHQGFNKISNEKINSKSPKARRKQSLSPSSLTKSNHNEFENSIKPKANDYEYDYDRMQKENSLNYDRSKYDYKYKSIKSDSAHPQDSEDRNRKSFEKEKDSYDYKSKNSSIRSSYKSNSYERFDEDGDVKSENKSFSNSYKKYSHSSDYVKNKYYHNAKKLPKFDLRYHLNKTVYKKNFNSFQRGEDSKNDFDSSKSGNYVNEESISTVRKRNLSNSRIDSSSKRQKE